jgi:hypothetical protein
MFNEFDHLITLAEKYDVPLFTIGLFYGAFKLQFCMITFEKFLKEYYETESHDIRLFILTNYLDVANLKFVKTYIGEEK